MTTHSAEPTKHPTSRPAHPPTSTIPWPRLYAEAHQRFGIKHFRPGQREVVEAIFNSRNVLALMPTGAGKSLCYQLPALFLPKLVVVVSPLIALMQDQQAKAQDARIAVEKIDSTLTPSQQAEVTQHIDHAIPQLVYVTPERLENHDFLDHLRATGVSLLAIDEAHCISQWGHDFRPAYMGLKYARERLGNPPVAALTATATAEVVEDILKQLGAEDAIVVDTGTERPNLAFAVHHTVNTAAKQNRLLQMIESAPGTGIVYTASVRTATQLHQWLTGSNISAALYHGRLPAKERAVVQQRFMRGDFKVLIATKAFGMGIDKPDIRFVYHYEFPDSLESYYQEGGRAGRDGKPANAVLLYRLEDRRIQSFFLVGRYPRPEELRTVLHALQAAAPANAAAIAERSGVPRRRAQAILYLLREAGLLLRTPRGYSLNSQPVSDTDLDQLLAGFTERSTSDKNRLDEMTHYAESATCRKQLLRTYFGENSGDPCGACDNCLEPGRATGTLPVLQAKREEAFEVPTAIGPVLTTAPETLPDRNAPSFATGDTVTHRRFGPGKVLDVAGENLIVRFTQGVKKVRTTYVRAA
jgi:ATP-dependent DNA helicase RecQ